jgi:hypothetical protein
MSTLAQPLTNTGITPLNQPQVNTTQVKPPATPTVTPQIPPPPAPVPTSSAPPTANTTQISPTNNLLSTQVNPGAPTATAPNTNFGTGAVTAGPAYNPTDSDRFANYSSKLDGSVNELTTGPNRTQMAMTALQDFDTAGQPQLEEGYRRVGQRAAALGRLGAGMTTNDLTGLSATYQRDRGLMARGLARDVAEGDINDRFRRVDALSGLRGQEEGIQSSRRGEQRTDRGYQTGVDQYNQGALFDRQRSANDYTGDYEDRLFGQRRSAENDLRGERDYQTERSDRAQEDQIRQRAMEEALLDSSFDRSDRRLAVGSQGSPSDAYERNAAGMSDEAGQLIASGADLFGQRAANQPVSQAGGLDIESLIKLLQGIG